MWMMQVQKKTNHQTIKEKSSTVYILWIIWWKNISSSTWTKTNNLSSLLDHPSFVSSCRHFRESFASRIEAKFGAGFSAKETKSKLPNTMMKHRKIHTPHKFGRLFFVGSKRLRFHEWETALLLLHFVRASSKTMEELDGVGCKVLQLQILGKLFVWKKNDKHLLYELKPPTRHPLLRLLSTPW